MGAKGGGLTDLAVGSNGQTAGFLPDLSEKPETPMGGLGTCTEKFSSVHPFERQTGLILVQISAAGFRKNGGHAQAGTCTET